LSPQQAIADGSGSARSGADSFVHRSSAMLAPEAAHGSDAMHAMHKDLCAILQSSPLEVRGGILFESQ
jgi:hypothetical protein